MTRAGGQDRISRKERIARAAIGMPADHPELLTRKPSRAEWKQLTTCLAELWPHDEYAAIIAEDRRQDLPPGTQGWSDHHDHRPLPPLRPATYSAPPSRQPDRP